MSSPLIRQGFLKDDNTYPVSIVTHGETVVVENEAGIGFKNSPIMGEVEIFKSDKSGSKLVGAGFHIFDADGQQVADGVTDENGTANLRKSLCQQNGRFPFCNSRSMRL